MVPLAREQLSGQASALVEPLISGEPDAAAVLEDYLVERGWSLIERGELARLPAGDLLEISRLLLRSGAWSAEGYHLLSCDIARSALEIWDLERPTDPRPREAIEAKLAWLRGELDDTGLKAARRAAEDASRDRRWITPSFPSPRASTAALTAAEAAAGVGDSSQPRAVRATAWLAARYASDHAVELFGPAALLRLIARQIDRHLTD